MDRQSQLGTHTLPRSAVACGCPSCFPRVRNNPGRPRYTVHVPSGLLSAPRLPGDPEMLFQGHLRLHESPCRRRCECNAVCVYSLPLQAFRSKHCSLPGPAQGAATRPRVRLHLPGRQAGCQSFIPSHLWSLNSQVSTSPLYVKVTSQVRSYAWENKLLLTCFPAAEFDKGIICGQPL